LSKFKTLNEFLQPLYSNVTVVTLEVLKNYILKQLDFSHYEDEADSRIANMIKTFIVEALDLNANFIARDHLSQAMRMKFELKLPVSAFFHIGLNAVIEHENNENVWLESVYQFYGSIEVESVQLELGQYIRNNMTFVGMEFEQFVYFLQDAKTNLS
jgi:hypothetical protein